MVAARRAPRSDVVRMYVIATSTLGRGGSRAGGLVSHHMASQSVRKRIRCAHAQRPATVSMTNGRRDFGVGGEYSFTRLNPAERDRCVYPMSRSNTFEARGQSDGEWH